MDLKLIKDSQKSEYNKLVSHVMQSWEWGEFRKTMGLKILRYGLFDDSKLKTTFQITFHKIPFLNQYVGYLPKGPGPDENLAKALIQIGKEQNCAFIKVEPNVPTRHPELACTERSECVSEPQEKKILKRFQDDVSKEFHPSPKPLFTKYNFIIDLTKSEEDLLKNMHPKTRYNIRVAQKHDVKVEERTDDEAFKIYLKLYFETTRRQGYHGHNEQYHRTVWKTLKDTGMARLLIATDNKEPLTAWMLSNFEDTLYYTYGGSSKSHPEVMANNLVCWEAIKLGKKLALKTFDMWGALGPDPDPNDPWIGFHRFKKGYGGDLVEYIGAYDLVLNWPVYWIFTMVDKLMPLKVFLLKLLGK